MSVLDAGCGTGAITAGIAAAVGADGFVVGIDRDPSLIATAREMHRGIPSLSFAEADLLTLESPASYDIATAARVLQWISEPGEAVRRMAACVKPGGLVVVLDYNHELNAWTPERPAEFRHFYQAFLAWRAASGWDNMMGDHLTTWMVEAGLTGIVSTRSDEVARRGEPNFDGDSSIWLQVIQGMGAHILPSPAELTSIQAAYRDYLTCSLKTQVLSLRTVTGTKRNRGL